MFYVKFSGRVPIAAAVNVARRNNAYGKVLRQSTMSFSNGAIHVRWVISWKS